MTYFATVRYGRMLLISKFKAAVPDLKPKEKCVVKTDRGRELGVLLTPLEELPADAPQEGFGEILRRAGKDDLSLVDKIEKEDRLREMKVCKEHIRRLNVPMKLVDVDHLFGGERIIFYFLSETRVDFRELVKALAQEFKARIELKQIGARDEARLVGDCGHCGLQLCCQSFLKELGGITMEMAKIQKHTADPSKITGRCGKLLCCLRYEYTIYTEAQEVLPAVGVVVQTKNRGEGKVVEQNLLLREITLEKADGDRIAVRLDELAGGYENRVPGCNGCSKGQG